MQPTKLWVPEAYGPYSIGAKTVGSSAAEQAQGANQLRLKGEKARVRAMYLEQAVSWCMGRIRILETQNKALKRQAAECGCCDEEP